METLNLIQGSDEWKAVRLNYLTASEAPAMMGNCKHTKRNELLHLKKTGDEKEISDYVERFVFKKGHEAEAAARPILEAQLGEDLYPVTGAKNVEGLMLLASFDGVTIMEDTSFEHKIWNKELPAIVQAQNLTGQHYWQLEHQLLVSEADKAIFVCSDGTTENWVQCEYTSVPERKARLIAGWKQFAKDLAVYEPSGPAQETSKRSANTLPSLLIEFKCSAVSSNLDIYKQAATKYISSISTELVTDQQFVDAQENVKLLKSAEDKLKDVKDGILEQSVSINDAVKVIEQIKKEMKDKRLELDGKIQAEKNRRKQLVISKASNDFKLHDSELRKVISPYEIEFDLPDIEKAIKGKKNLDSIQNAADTAVANAKVAANQKIEQAKANIALLNKFAADYKFLFNDFGNHLLSEAIGVEAIIKNRIADYQEEQESRKAEEKVKQEEAPKIAIEPQNKVAVVNKEQLTAAKLSSVSAVPETQNNHAGNAKANLAQQLEHWAKRNAITNIAMRELLTLLGNAGIEEAA